MIKKIISLSVATLMMVSTFVGCGSKSATDDTSAASTVSTVSEQSSAQQTVKEPVKLIFFSGSVEMVDFWNQYFDKYNKSNKDGITVEQIFQKEGTSALQVRLASGDVPDIINVSATQAMVDAKTFVDVTDWSFWKDLSPNLKSISFDVKTGRNFRIPLLQGNVGLYYNKAIFNELGLKPAKTWAEFINNCKVIKEKKPDIDPLFIGSKDAWMLDHMAQFIFHGSIKQKIDYAKQQDAMINGKFDVLQWNTDTKGALVTYLNDLMELKNLGLINSNVITADYGAQTTAFATGKAAMISQGLWAGADIMKKAPNGTDDFGICAYPAILDGDKPTFSSSGDNEILLAAASKRQDEIKKVVDCMLSVESMKEISEAKKSPSSNVNVVSDWGFLKNDVSNLLKDDGVAKLPWSAGPSGFTGDDQGKFYQSVLAGKYKTAEEAAADFLETWKKAVK